MARKNPKPYHVTEVKSSDILDWKTYSQKRGVLRVRHAEDGQQIDWTKFKQVRVLKQRPEQLRFKVSHLDDEFSVIDISNSRRGTESNETQLPESLYTSLSKLSFGKFTDLQSLCVGQTPLIYHPDYRTFYANLPHETR